MGEAEQRVLAFVQRARVYAATHVLPESFSFVHYDADGNVQTAQLRGLLAVLRHTFYPEYQVKKRHLNSSSVCVGLRVDGEMQNFVAAGRRLPHGYHPFSLELVRALCHHKIRLLATQVPLLDPKQCILTHADAVGLDCRDPDHPVPILIDFKTGYDVGYTWSGGVKLESPFERVPANQKNQHHLQLAWELVVAAQPPYCMTFKAASILLVNPKGATRMDLPAWCSAKRRRLMIEKLHH